jgi:8-oxo-dGTP pyrophosphatase MutT (NUDIX family)
LLTFNRLLKMERQMYKIYINDNPLFLTSEDSTDLTAAGQNKHLVLRYDGKKKFLLNVIDQLEKSKHFRSIVLFYEDPGKLWSDFCGLFDFIEAAGGVVFNGNQEVLLIYRRGYWDLPKGKIDPGETPPQAALREVREETGLKNIVLHGHLTDTFHTYEQKNKRILKKTWWYSMHTSDSKLQLQHEEDIESAQWTGVEKFLENPDNVYGNIVEVLKKSMKEK